MSRDHRQGRVGAHRLQKRLLEWLINEACPLWSTHGVDRVLGGFHERLNGTAGLHEPRRARVQPRQVSAFAMSAALGWRGDAAELASHGLHYFLAHFRRPDGLFRTLIAPEGTPLDDRALLYDQAFALLGFAESERVLGPRSVFGPRAEDEARLLRTAVYRHLKRAGAGFESGLPRGQPLSSNAHMHLLEAALAWLEASDDAEWSALAEEIGTLALSRFIDASSGAVREHFTATWSPMPGLEGRILEPGHHFEWAWLLLRWAGADRAEVCRAAFRLIDIGEQHGVRNGVAVNALLDDFSVHDASARLWPQTERLKAAALAAGLTGEPRYWTMAEAAANALLRYLDTKVPGSWYDRQTPDGQMIDEPAPASSFYHIVAAIAQLTAAVEETRADTRTAAIEATMSSALAVTVGTSPGDVLAAEAGSIERVTFARAAPVPMGLVGDIGGTHVRFGISALDAHASGAIEHVRKFNVRDFPSLESAITHYLRTTDGLPSCFRHAAIAVATRLDGDRVSITNNPWTFSIHSLEAAFGFERLRVVNDLEAIGHALASLASEDFRPVGPQSLAWPLTDGVYVVVGVGTGLGVCGVLLERGTCRVIASEGGHVGFAPADEASIQVLRWLGERHGRVSAERVLSGPGLLNVLSALNAVDGLLPEQITPEEITARARRADDPLCVEAAALFCRLLGAFAGDVALMFGAWRGVLLSGAMLQSFAPRMFDEQTRAGFEDKGRFAETLRTVPLALITRTDLELVGAASLLNR
jgi:glucokinase